MNLARLLTFTCVLLMTSSAAARTVYERIPEFSSDGMNSMAVTAANFLEQGMFGQDERVLLYKAIDRGDETWSETLRGLADGIALGDVEFVSVSKNWFDINRAVAEINSINNNSRAARFALRQLRRDLARTLRWCSCYQLIWVRRVDQIGGYAVLDRARDEILLVLTAPDA